MDTTAQARRNGPGWRPVRGGAAVVAAVTVGLALTAGTADAMPNNASAEADHFMGLAEGALGDMAGAC